VKNAIKLAFFREDIISPEKLSKILEAESIHMILRKSRDGQLYGITYVDHKTRSVFNGSSLGKEFSAKGIQESCAMNILAHERKNQNSVSTNSENYQDLESREYVKENLADILLRGEKINDYVSKQFKPKKKKRLFKGV
jgi:hypothetical protein